MRVERYSGEGGFHGGGGSGDDATMCCYLRFTTAHRSTQHTTIQHSTGTVEGVGGCSDYMRRIRSPPVRKRSVSIKPFHDTVPAPVESDGELRTEDWLSGAATEAALCRVHCERVVRANRSYVEGEGETKDDLWMEIIKTVAEQTLLLGDGGATGWLYI